LTQTRPTINTLGHQEKKMVQSSEAQMGTLVKCAKASVLVQLQAHVAEDEREKPEILLARAGFVAREIAEMLGKSQAAVAKAVQRGGRAA
jgi:hypothetical protein